MRQDPHSGIGCECIYLRMRLVPGRVSGAVVEGCARVGGHPASDASVGLRPVVAFCFCLHLVGGAHLGQSDRACRCVARGRLRGPRAEGRSGRPVPFSVGIVFG